MVVVVCLLVLQLLCLRYLFITWVVWWGLLILLACCVWFDLFCGFFAVDCCGFLLLNCLLFNDLSLCVFVVCVRCFGLTVSCYYLVMAYCSCCVYVV